MRSARTHALGKFATMPAISHEGAGTSQRAGHKGRLKLAIQPKTQAPTIDVIHNASLRLRRRLGAPGARLSGADTGARYPIDPHRGAPFW